MDTINLKPKSTKTTGFLPEDALFFSSGEVSWRVSLKPHVWVPPTDLYETDDRYIVLVEIAGMAENDLSVRIDQNKLLISGVRSDAQELRAYHRMEIHFGEFATEVDLPGPIVADHIDADYQNGFLRISLPKAQPKHISIEG